MMRWGTLLIIAACASPQPEEHAVEQDLTQCATTVVEGLDVYNGTGTIDWAKVQASGRGFAFIKAPQGDYNVQSSFAGNWANALAAGVKRSPYLSSDGSGDGVALAHAFLAQVQAAGGPQVADLPALPDI